MRFYSINEIASEVHLKPRTIRFYAKQGLKTVHIGNGQVKPRKMTTLEWFREFVEKNAKSKFEVKTKAQTNKGIFDKLFDKYKKTDDPATNRITR